MRHFSRLLLSIVFLLAGCSNLSALVETPTGVQTSTPSQTRQPTATRQTVTPSPTPNGPVRMRVWLPPYLSPTSEEPAGILLKKRLEEFQSRNPDLIIETRVKSLSGAGGLLDSLVTASAAAPAALPDLVALPRNLLEAAALKGLLLPLDNLTTSLTDPDWYPYATELAHLQNNLYGFPFAGDAMVQVYYTEGITQPLTSWSAVIEAGKPFIFPAGSEDALFTLAEYQANGGKFRDEEGRPTLNTAPLTDVFFFYNQAVQAGLLSGDQLSQFQNDDQVWEAFTAKNVPSAITWSSRYIGGTVDGTAFAQIPTPRGKPFALANGWVWALVGRDETKRDLAVELAEFLTDSHFLADWSQAAGYLPTRPSSLSLWSDENLRAEVGQIASVAQLIPPTDILSTLRTPLQQATLAVLKGQSDPAIAARTAASSLTSP